MNTVDRQKLRGYIEEISHSLTRQAAEKELIKEICDRAKEELEMAPKTLRKLGKIHYENSLQEMQQDMEELVELYEGAVKSSTTRDVEDEESY